MDRLCWSSGSGSDIAICSAPGVCLYDGDSRSAFETGTLQLYPTYMLWTDSSDQACSLILQLALVRTTKTQSKSFTHSAKIVVNLFPASPNRQMTPVMQSSSFDYVMLSFRQGGEAAFMKCLKDVLEKKAWLKPSLPGRKTRSGIVGIERQLGSEHAQSSADIKNSFDDVRDLMNSAKQMVELSNSISNKIRSRQGEITEDETVKFKSYLLGLGIDDPVTKEATGGGHSYHHELARELSMFLSQHLPLFGGVMSLFDVYCRVNRARGIELISPEDLLAACELFDKDNMAVRLHRFDSGVLVVLDAQHNFSATLDATCKIVTEAESVTEEQFGAIASVPVLLARERLIYAERNGRLCRDESAEGLRFYSNRFALES